MILNATFQLALHCVAQFFPFTIMEPLARELIGLYNSAAQTHGEARDGQPTPEEKVNRVLRLGLELSMLKAEIAKEIEKTTA